MAKNFASIVSFLIFSGILYGFVYLPNSEEINEKLNINWELPKFFSGSKDDSGSDSKSSKRSRNSSTHVAAVLDRYKGVKIYSNGSVRNVHGRNVAPDGYNLGLKYQCVEFVKRFYYEVYNHKMPNSYGHAKEFFNHSLSDGAYNKDRAMRQYRNGSSTRPQADDLIVFGAASFNKFGHVAIISEVGDDYVEIAQQNPGVNNPSRAKYQMINNNGRYRIVNQYVDGWLRL